MTTTITVNDSVAGGNPITVTHQLTASGYAVDPASINPQGTVSASGIVWSGQQPAGSAAPLTFQVTGQVTNLAPGEVRQISQGTTVIAPVVVPTRIPGRSSSPTLPIPDPLQTMFFDIATGVTITANTLMQRGSDVRDILGGEFSTLEVPGQDATFAWMPARQMARWISSHSHNPEASHHLRATTFICCHEDHRQESATGQVTNFSLAMGPTTLSDVPDRSPWGQLYTELWRNKLSSNPNRYRSLRSRARQFHRATFHSNNHTFIRSAHRRAGRGRSLPLLLSTKPFNCHRSWLRRICHRHLAAT